MSQTLKVDPASVSRWSGGQTPVPPVVGVCVELLVAEKRRHQSTVPGTPLGLELNRPVQHATRWRLSPETEQQLDALEQAQRAAMAQFHRMLLD